MASIAPKTNVLGRRLAAHLLRRTTYCYTIKQVKEFQNLTPSAALQRLLKPPTLTIDEPRDLDTGQPWINSGVPSKGSRRELQRLVMAWWTSEAQQDPTISHRMMTFLHTTFSANIESIGNPAARYDHLHLLRFFALGNFKTFAKKMTTDVCMLFYLDNNDNTEEQPNENWSRELLEVFSIGKGNQIGESNYTNYTEHDIQQAARVFTAFNNGTKNANKRGNMLHTDTGIYGGKAYFRKHDTGDKTFSSAFQNTTIKGATGTDDMWRELGDFFNMVFSQLETAKFLSRRMYRFFVRNDISQEVENDIILPLAQTLFANDYELKPALEQLLSSRHFYDEDDANSQNEIIGALVKSPLELMLQAVSVLEPKIPSIATQNEDHYYTYFFGMEEFFVPAKMPRFEPESVAGFPGYHQAPNYSRLWFNASTLIPRYKLPDMLLTHERFSSKSAKGGIKIDIVKFVRSSGYFSNPENANLLVQTFIDYLLPESVSTVRFNYFRDALLGGLSTINWSMEWKNYISSGDDASVHSALSNFIKALMGSPEYQLF